MNIKSSSDLSIVTAGTARELVLCDPAGCVDVVRQAYEAHANRQTVNPPSVFLMFPDTPDARIIALPAHLGAPWRVSGIKWIASYPANTALGIERASAVLILNECTHGRPFACLEASVVSAARTAASAALAAQALWQRREKSIGCLGIVGTGHIARYVYRFLAGTGWQIEQVKLFDTAPSAAARFAAWLADIDGAPAADCAGTLAELVRECDLILFATLASVPHMRDVAALGHKPLILHLSLRDLGPEVIRECDNVVDDPSHAFSANTSLHLAEQTFGNRDFLTGSLMDIVHERARCSGARPVVFSPFGLGVLDVALGKWLLDKAEAAGRTQRIRDFLS